MADPYTYLTDAERVTYNETSRLMQLSDWDAFDDLGLSDDLNVTQAWIRQRRVYIEECAEGEVDGKQPGWDVSHRRERYDYLHKANYADAAPHDLCQLPNESATDAEGCMIALREMWWMNPSSAYTDQSIRRQDCIDWLVARRQYVWRCAEGEIDGKEPGWDVSDRTQRYANLQVATKMGSAYADWCTTHDPATGQPAEAGSGGSGSGSARDRALSWAANHLGLTEQPDGSNCDNRSDGIRALQDRTAGGSDWLRYQPWCGCFCFAALDHAGVNGLSSNIASVAWCEDQAKAGRAPFTGWTADGTKAKPGDLVIMFGYGGHVGMLRSTPGSGDGYADTVEGNTSNTSANRSRSRSGEIRGYCRVAYP